MDSPITDTSSSESENKQDLTYKPVSHHWYFQVNTDDKSGWKPFSHIDSKGLENAFISLKSTPDTVVTTDGGRYDVNLSKRERLPVYWRDNATPVRRCSWFFKGTTDPRFVPYSEDVADILEEEYRLGIITSTWNRKIALHEEEVVLHSASIMMRFIKASTPDSWGSAPFLPSWTVHRGNSGAVMEPDEPIGCADHLLFIVHGIGEPKKEIKSPEFDQAPSRARTVRRAPDGTDVEEGEKEDADHLLMLIHGIGSVCDLKMRSVEEVVNDFRAISAQLVQSHYKSSCDQGVVNRIEVLPISWHWNLHSEESGIDKRIAQITLESVPKFRNFTNDTLLDILFYTSPKFCQTIIDTVGNEMNRIYALYKARNPNFKGGISLGGHSLGSVILFDLLCHQKPQSDLPTASSEPPSLDKNAQILGTAGTGQPSIIYPQLSFNPMSFFALGSPIGMFICVRGIEELGEDFKLPNCPGFFNIFHPFDPVAYRIESLICSELTKFRPIQVPHHKGRKRMHLELKDTVTRVGADLKQKIVDSMRNTWDSLYQLAVSPTQAALQEKVKEVIQEQLIQKARAEAEASNGNGDTQVLSEAEASLLKNLGKLNNGRRVDYVLQEAPFELFNEYIFAMASHVCYWESEDTMLLIIKEIYSGIGIESDRQIPQQTMTIERPITDLNKVPQ